MIGKLGVKINSQEEDHLQDGDDLFIIGELHHKEIDKKMYLYVLSTMDKAGIFIIEDKVLFTEKEIDFQPTLSLEKYVDSIKLRFKENFNVYT